MVKTPILDRFFYNVGITNYNVGITNPSGIRHFLEIRQFARPNRINQQEIVETYLESAKQPNSEYAAFSLVRGDLCLISLLLSQPTHRPHRHYLGSAISIYQS